ncbi:SLC18B1 [Bugula neritina]|uniref:SLC18B1 n=1 Tax=Bugula neritina TaxID=10212 RepID=A0A7J7KCQ9_BUGNE|nr:SLC18B1 [Bugula neritina]
MDKKLLLLSINSPWKDRTLTLVVLTVQFMAMTTDTFLIPFFPPEAKGKGISDTEIGMVFSAFEFSKVISAFIVGRLIDIIRS